MAFSRHVVHSVYYTSLPVVVLGGVVGGGVNLMRHRVILDMFGF